MKNFWRCGMLVVALSLASWWTVRAAETTEYKTADELWAHVLELENGPSEEPKSQAEMQGFITQVQQTVDTFVQKYPRDERRWQAKLLSAQMGSVLGRMTGDSSASGKMKQTLEEVANAPDAQAALKGEARYGLLQYDFQAADGKLTPDLEKKIAAFSQDFPESPHLPSLQMARVDLMKAANPAQAEQLLQTLSKSPDPQLAAEAQGWLRALEAMKKPLDLHFKSVSGAEVDLQKLRGKVVVIDFWATWCEPCMAEVPQLVATYQALHSKGMEIVGISLDQDLNKLKSVTKEKGMTWAQYFDGQGWQNELSSRYGISFIPTMWLVNKKGMIVDQEAGEDLRGKVEKLLAE